MVLTDKIIGFFGASFAVFPRGRVPPGFRFVETEWFIVDGMWFMDINKQGNRGFFLDNKISFFHDGGGRWAIGERLWVIGNRGRMRGDGDCIGNFWIMAIASWLL
jgi:hypothetical protein